MSSRILLGGLSLFGLVPFVMIAMSSFTSDYTVGLSLMLAAAILFIVGLTALVQDTGHSDRIMCECFDEIDREHPELVEIMEKYKDERVREEGSSPTF